MFSRSPDASMPEPTSAPIAPLRETPMTPPAPQTPVIIPGSSPADVGRGRRAGRTFISRGTVRVMGA
jgi:hypothetical protein